MHLSCIVSVWNNCLSSLRFPLISTSRALCQLPFVTKQVFKVVVAPLSRSCRPSNFKTTGNRVSSLTRLETAHPAKTLSFQVSHFRIVSQVVSISSTMALTKRMTTCNQSNRFLIIHRHAGKGLANIFRRLNGVRIAVRTFRIDINQSHLNRR